MFFKFYNNDYEKQKNCINTLQAIAILEYVIGFHK